MKSLITIACLVWACAATAQVSIGIKVMGLTFHPKPSPHPQLYPDGKDAQGKWVQIGGLFFTAEWEVVPNRIALHAAQGVMLDCGNQFAGFSHIGVKGLLRHGPHTLGASMGPSWFYRKSWRDMPGYVDEGLFAYNEKWQHSFYWYAGSIEYDYRLSEQNSLSVNLIPGWPEVFVASAGVKHHFSPSAPANLYSPVDLSNIRNR